MLLSLGIVARAIVSSPAPSGGTSTSGIVRADTTFGYIEVEAADARAAISEGEAAQVAAREVLALHNVRFGIATPRSLRDNWVTLSPSGKPVYSWVFSNKSADRNHRPPSHVLRHEIGHDLFIRYLVPSSRQDQYGGDAPDWLDEMAAVAFEDEKLTASRRRQAARFAKEDTLIPLSRYLSMSHPEALAGAPATPTKQVRMRLATSAESPQFYAMGRAFYDFLVDRTKNKAIIAELAAAFRSGQPLEQWILTRTGYLEKPDGLSVMDADLQSFIALDERYANHPKSEAGQ